MATFYWDEDKERKKNLSFWDTINEVNKLAKGESSVQEVVDKSLTPEIKSQTPSTDFLKEFEASEAFGALKDLADIISQGNLQEFVKSGIEQAGTSTVDPIYLKNLLTLYNLGQYGIPVSNLTMVFPQATTEYQETLDELNKLYKKIGQQAMDITENPPKREEPKFLPFLALLSALGGMAGGIKGALPFLALGAALKGGLREAYESQVDTSKLILAGVEEARKTASERFKIAKEKYSLEEKKLQELEEALQNLDLNAVSNTLSEFSNNLKQTGDIIDSLNKLDPVKRTLLMRTSTGRQILDKANSQIILQLSDKLQKERTILAHNLQLLRQKYGVKTDEIKEIQDFAINPDTYYLQDMQKTIQRVRTDLKNAQSDLLSNLLASGNIDQLNKINVQDLFKKDEQLIVNTIDNIITTAFSSYGSGNSMALTRKFLLLTNPDKDTLTRLMNAWEMKAITQLVPYLKQVWINYFQQSRPIVSVINTNNLKQMHEKLKDFYKETWYSSIPNNLLDEEMAKKVEDKADSFATIFLDAFTDGAYSTIIKDIKKNQTQQNQKQTTNTQQKKQQNNSQSITDYLNKILGGL